MPTPIPSSKGREEAPISSASVAVGVPCHSAGWRGVDRLFPLPQVRNPPSSTLLLDKDGNLLRAFLAPDEMWRLRVESERDFAATQAATLAMKIDTSDFIRG